MNKTVLLIGTGYGSPDVVARLKRLGLGIILVELKHMFDPARAADADEIILTDYRQESFITFALGLRALRHYDHVISITEFGVAVAARLNRLLGLRGSDEESVRLLNDKAAMRAALRERGFAPVAHRLLSDAAQLAAFWEEAGGPLILKPVDGAGSTGIRLAHTLVEARGAWHELRGQGYTVLAEEFIDGLEYSVEAFSFEGRHQVIAITQKFVDEQFVEVGHVVPAMLDEATAAQVKRFVADFLGVIGVTNGPTHTEMKIGSKGMRVIESHNRLGGGNIPRLVELTYGVDLIGLSAQWACGMVGPMVPQQEPLGAAAIRFFVFPPGLIRSIDGLDALAQATDSRCVYRSGDTVAPTVNNSGRAGYVIVHGDSARAAIDRAGELAHLVRATVDTPQAPRRPDTIPAAPPRP